jgi:hypothetical protein
MQIPDTKEIIIDETCSYEVRVIIRNKGEKEEE